MSAPTPPPPGAPSGNANPASFLSGTWTRFRGLPRWAQILAWAVAWPALTALLIASRPDASPLRYGVAATTLLLGGPLWIAMLQGEDSDQVGVEQAAAREADAAEDEETAAEEGAAAAEETAEAEAEAEEHARVEAEEEAAEAEAEREAAEQAAAEEAEAAAAAEEAEAAAAAGEAELQNPDNYTTLADRDFALLVKNPDDHVGDQIVLYGEVSQFDAATGNDTFRAQASNVMREYWYSEGENVVVMGDADLLHDIVADDVVKMHVTSLGSLSYGTQIGGETTVPLFHVNIIELVD